MQVWMKHPIHIAITLATQKDNNIKNVTVTLISSWDGVLFICMCMHEVRDGFHMEPPSFFNITSITLLWE